MNTKAIYTVHENGKEHYFFSEHAGGFSYPFAVADFLYSLKGVLNDPMSPQKGLCELKKSRCFNLQRKSGRHLELKSIWNRIRYHFISGR